MDKDIIFKNFYNEYFDYIYRYVLINVTNKETAEDLTQDIFIKVYLNFDQFQNKSSISTWAFKIARNHVLDYFKKSKIKIMHYQDDIFNTDLFDSGFEDLVFVKEDLKALYVAINKLNKSYKEVIILRKISNFSIKETALILGWSEDKVKSQMSRGLVKLKSELNVREEKKDERKRV